ncbi:STAS domain-containing protein [Streptomyces sp. DH37]|uniref:STAS domain-containing protein n=1 Tax=Streptomyces sp. DH37 TaxID=3040122 RepID=UPI0024433656|nr:STAS domain-containing protein [Streptomyces sp. DH37]MDG9704984.1 STAS domain-containing protein [Streptomyces sp. DH37]
MAVHEEPRTPDRKAALVLAADGPLTRADIPRLCERLRRVLVRARVDPVVVDAGESCAADMVTVEALARLRLTAHRLGGRIRLAGADGELRRLLAWTGLDEEAFAADTDTDAPEGDAVGADAGGAPGPDRSAGAEPRGQPEQGKQPGGVQEGVERGDPAP